MRNFLTAEEAIELFDVLSKADHIVHEYISEGCYARAHLGCQLMDERGYEPNKAWLIEDRAKTMLPEIPGVSEDANVNFTYHVAPSLPVERPDGEIVDMVFDPSFFDGPAELDEWAFVIDKDPPYADVKAFGQAPDGYKHDYKIIEKPMSSGPEADAHARDLMMKNRDELDNNEASFRRRVVFASELRANLQKDMLSKEFQKSQSAEIEVVPSPDRDRIRPKRYWEIDMDDPDALDAFYD